ncbi:hypothetical protein BVY04_02590 [bacterium M21]|nr:hypothetical protein BVY04_02590 [bacterium M21]
MTEQELIDKAAELFQQGKFDEVIDVLRAPDAPNYKDRCNLLALAYFSRGDAKGDVYSAHFFAERAMELGHDSKQLPAIQAICDYRKGKYEVAAAEFEQIVTKDSSAAQQFLYGLTLLQLKQDEKAQPYLDRAKVLAPEDPVIAKGGAFIKDSRYIDAASMHSPTWGNMFVSLTAQLKASDDAQIDSPYPHNPVSKLRGIGTDAKDLDWVAQNIPCQDACPAGTNIPEYLTSIYNGDYDAAYTINLEDNVFPAVLGRVCARPCESSCRHGWEGLGEPVSICWSKRSAADHKEKDLVVLDKVGADTGKRVAIIGGGPAGLASARQLARLGHIVEVFEKHKRPGGMMNQGIPVFRLPRDIIEKEVSQIEALGVKITCNTEVGKDITLGKLTEDFDAVVIAAGTLRPNLLNLPGKELKGIHHGLEFLLDVNEGDGFDIGKKVVVIGGGFTAMDCARTAWRLDSHEVKVLYRRSQDEMLITPGELEELDHEGIPMEFMVSPVAYIGDEDDQVKAMRFIRNELGEPDDSGRRRPVAIEGSEFELPVDTVLLATGQFPETSWIDEALKKDLVGDDQWPLDYKKHKTAKEKIFLAGDFSTGANSLIAAIGHAKQTVIEVDEFLVGERRVEKAVIVSDVERTGRIREMDFVPAQKMPAIPVSQRELLAEVETGYTQDLAVDETQRCYRCHYKFEIDNDKCIYCDWCVNAKPRPNCIVKVKELDYAEDGRITGWQEAKNSDEKKMIFINQEDCIRCGACVEACPVDAIDVQKVSSRTICDLQKLKEKIVAKQSINGHILGS